MTEQRHLQPQGRAPIAPRDRRQAERFASAHEALVSPLDSRQTAIPVQIRDISSTGIGLLTPRRYERGTALFIQVQDDGPEMPPMLVAKVMHVTAAEDGGWLVGCELTRSLSATDLEGLADGPPV
jgi:hypothetical protein